MKRYINKSYLLYTCCLVIFTFSACKKSDIALPGDTEAVALNFYSVSDVMLTAYGLGTPQTNGRTAIQVDTFQTNPVRQYPIIDYRFPNELEFPTTGNTDFMNFSSYNAKPDGHRLFFTDTANVIVLDTVIHPQAKSYTCVYLADAPQTANARAAYRMLGVIEDRAGVPAGKVGVRFVNLSPDAGKLDCSFLKADGSTTLLLNDGLDYGTASAYQYLDSTAVVSGLVKFALNSNTTNAQVLAGAPFTPGHSYIIVIAGFLADQQRQVRSGTNPDGSAKYTSITINRNLRAIVRKSY